MIRIVLLLAGLLAGLSAPADARAPSARTALLSSPAPDIATQQLVAAMTTRPSGDRIRMIDYLMRALQGGGVWPYLDVYHVMAAHCDAGSTTASQAGRLNWKNAAANSLTLSGTTTVTCDRGITGSADGVASTGYSPLAASLGLAQNDAGASVWALTNGSVTGIAAILADNSRIRVRARINTSASVAISSNTTVALTTGGNVPHVIGVNRRGDPSNIIPFRNFTDEPSGASVSAGLPSTVSYLGNATVGTFTDQQVAIAGVGRALPAELLAAKYFPEAMYLRWLGAIP